MPLKSMFVIVSSISWKSANEMAKPTNHQSGVLRFKTIALILSVTEPKVSSDPTTGWVAWIDVWRSSC